jgi:hypothetical protein
MSRAERTLPALGYPDGRYSNTYYTAQCARGIGVAVWDAGDFWFIQLFTWGNDEWVKMPTDIVHPLTGHSRYARHVIHNAKNCVVENLPYMKCSIDADLLTIKCLIEEGINQCRLSSK